MSESVPNVAWIPSPQDVAQANVTAVAQQLGLTDYPALHAWSVANREAFWQLAIERLGVRSRRPWQRLLDLSRPTQPQWLVGARLNIVDSCLQGDDDAVAIIESDASNRLSRTTYGQLRREVARVANALVNSGIGTNDAVGIVMPMNGRAVAAYLGVLAVGAAVISIADSFAPQEIATRLRIGKAKLVLTQDAVQWGGKRLPLYDKVVQAGAGRVVVVSTDDGSSPSLRPDDQSWNDFLRGAGDSFVPVERDPHDVINILFSSGTTGEPKAIPWDHTTPIKCAADAHFHQDVHADDVVCWPTSLGWMMGPWLIFASLMNRATMALHGQAPTDAAFGQFVRDAGVTKLGLVPSMVRHWRATQCIEGIDWSAIKAFSSSGECSNADDMAYLMQLAGNKPIIEYCGGTEIGGAYITSTVVQPNVPAAFSTPALGIDIALRDENGHPTSDRGEAFIVGPSIGLSTRLLNRDHDSVYFADVPAAPAGSLVPLRRHGDELERLLGGYWRATGRCDDTMNLGGIKVGCAEIERVLNPLPGVHETAAIAVSPAGGGPSRLVVFVVAKPDAVIQPKELQPTMQQAIRQQLNPLFRIDDVRVVPALPRTASNKVMRRELRAACG